MGQSEHDPGAKGKPAWNAGRKLGAKRALKPQQVWAIRFWLDSKKRMRDRAMFDLAIDSKLRGCDIVKIKIGDLTLGGRVRSRAIVVQQKTKRPVQFELLDHAQGSLNAWLERRGGAVTDYVFPSRIDHAKPISTRQYARLVDTVLTQTEILPADLAYIVRTVATRLEINHANARRPSFHAYGHRAPALAPKARRRRRAHARSHSAGVRRARECRGSPPPRLAGSASSPMLRVGSGMAALERDPIRSGRSWLGTASGRDRREASFNERWHWMVYENQHGRFVRDGQVSGDRDQAERAARLAIAIMGGVIREATG